MLCTKERFTFMFGLNRNLLPDLMSRTETQVTNSSWLTRIIEWQESLLVRSGTKRLAQLVDRSRYHYISCFIHTTLAYCSDKILEIVTLRWRPELSSSLFEMQEEWT